MTKPTKSGPREPEVEIGAMFRRGYRAAHGLDKGRECTGEENDACMTVVVLLLGKKLTISEAQERIQEILNPCPF